MKKTLLIAAAALAAGVISSQAQGSVYSQNIVGYVNLPINGGNAFNLITSPIGGTNAVEVAVPNINIGDNVFIWTGVGYNILTYFGPNWDGAGHNWADGNGAGQQSPVVNPGQSFFYQNSGGTFTNTFVGNVVLSNSVVLYGGNAFNLIASTAPISDVADGTNLALPYNVGDNIFVWTGTGYNILTYFGSNWDGAGHNWADGNGAGQPSPTIPVGQGFFYQNSGSTFTWNQNIIVQ